MNNGTIVSRVKTWSSLNNYPRSTVTLTWNSVPNFDNNTSTINWCLSIYNEEKRDVYPQQNFNRQTDFFDEIVIYSGGEAVFSSTTRHPMIAGTWILEEGSFEVAHNDDGSKICDLIVSCFGGVITHSVLLTLGGTITLDHLLLTSIVSANNGSIESTTNITIDKKDTTHKNTVTYQFYSLSGIIAENTTASTIYRWYIPSDFYWEIPNSKSGICVITCTTYTSDGTWVGSSQCEITVICSEIYCKPYFEAFDIRDVNPVTVALTGDSSVFVRYASDAGYDFEPAARNGATVVACWLEGKNILNQPAGTLEKVEEAYFSGHIMDSRSFRLQYYAEFDLIEYIKLTCNLSISSVSKEGTVEYHLSGEFWQGNFGTTDNTLHVQYRWRPIYGAFGDWLEFDAEPSIGGQYYDLIGTFDGFDPAIQYVFEARAIDKVRTISSKQEDVAALPVFDWGVNDFNFNVPVTILGNYIADYPITYGSEAMGTNGTWRFVKWASGRAECYGIRNFGAMGVSTTFGSLYRSAELSQTYPEGLFMEPPIVNMNIVRTDDYFGWLAAGGEGTETATPSFYVVRPATTNLTSSYIAFHAIGRWDNS